MYAAGFTGSSPNCKLKSATAREPSSRWIRAPPVSRSLASTPFSTRRAAQMTDTTGTMVTGTLPPTEAPFNSTAFSSEAFSSIRFPRR
ncbi:hypothetical protein D3C78_1549660 [compost metagenome]